MKTIQEIRNTPRLIIVDSADDGFRAYGELASTKGGKHCQIQGSWGGGWDHVSVSFPSRCPTWEEMCEVKRMLFRPDEVVVQFHPAEKDYINTHPYCLHLFRHQFVEPMTPPTWMVGLKKGQTIADARREMERDMKISAQRQVKEIV